jgi:hypothetical protein
MAFARNLNPGITPRQMEAIERGVQRHRTVVGSPRHRQERHRPGVPRRIAGERSRTGRGPTHRNHRSDMGRDRSRSPKATRHPPPARHRGPGQSFETCIRTRDHRPSRA